MKKEFKVFTSEELQKFVAKKSLLFIEDIQEDIIYIYDLYKEKYYGLCSQKVFTVIRGLVVKHRTTSETISYIFE